MNAMSLIKDSLVQQLGWTLVHSLWQGVVFAALLAVVLRLMRTAPAAMRYVAACAAMGLMVLAVASTFYVLTPRETVISSRPIAVRIAAAELPAATARPVAPRIIVAAPSDSRDVILRSLVAVWLVGVGAMSAWHIAGWMWLQRLRRGGRVEALEEVLRGLSQKIGIDRVVRIVQSTRVDVPAVVGALRPVILVPLGILNDLPAAQIEAILAHELAHIRRHDYFVNLIQAVIESVMFYHPATWWISAQIRIERENCCDDIAAGVCGDRRTYAAALAAMEERRGSAAMHLAPAVSGGRLIDRVRRLLRLPPARASAGRLRSLAAGVVTLMCIGLPVAVVAQNKTPTNTPDTTKPSATTSEAPSTPIRPEDLQTIVEDYRIGQGDHLAVTIIDLVGPGVETIKQVRVSETGKISLPYVGEVKVTGLTAPESERAVSKAFKDGRFMANAQVGVQVNQALGRTFSVLGQVDRPGQYQITQADFRVLDAMAMAGGRPSSIDGLRIIRKNGDAKRVLEIPLTKLAAGDLQFNLVIRPGDMLIAAPAEKQSIHVVIGKDNMRVDGVEMDVAALTRRVEAMADSQRRNTFIEAAAATPDVTVERFFGVTAQLFELVKNYHLSHFSQTGVERSAKPSTTQAAAVGVYYINGNVKRPGAYSFGGREITLAQALAAAGGLEESAGDYYVQVERKVGTETEVVLPPVEVKAILDGTAAKFWMQADYSVMVKPAPMTVDDRKVDDRIANIATVDPTMRKYIDERNAMEINLAKLSRTRGSANPAVMSAKQDIDLQRKRIDEYAKALTAATLPAAR